jgi:acyl-coenzyme A synthetase/AMP-(fatty) acid ligase
MYPSWTPNLSLLQLPARSCSPDARTGSSNLSPDGGLACRWVPPVLREEVERGVNMTDYEETRRTFRLGVPEDFNYTRDVVEAWARREPSKLALVAVDRTGEGQQEFTFADMARGSNRVANALEGLGVGAGERAFVMLPRIPQWYELLLGMFRHGTVPMPATILCTARDIEYRVNKAEATIAVTDADGAAKVEEVLDRCPTLKRLIVVEDETPSAHWSTYASLVEQASDATPNGRPSSHDDPLLIYFTSGTVAYPKMVLHTHASYGIGHEITARFWQDLTPSDLHWTVSDTGWAKAAWGKLFGQWRLGSAIFLWDQRGRFDPDQGLRVLERSGVTTFCAPPTLFRAFVQLDLSRYNLSHVRHSVSAGEPLNPEVIKVWKEVTGTTIYDGYGQTETVNIVANYPCMPVKPGSMGRPTPTFDVDVVDEEGNRLDAGEEGNIAVRVEPERPVGLMKEYWKDPDATAAAVQHGWYFTGDRATRDEDGYLWFVGRADDVIISAS